MTTSVRVPRPASVPRTELHVDPRFLPLADRFFAMYRQPQHGGGALTAYFRGEKVLDIWAGWADRDRRWDRDTVALSFSTGKGVASTVVHRLAERRLTSIIRLIPTARIPSVKNNSSAAANRRSRGDTFFTRLLEQRASNIHRVQTTKPDGPSPSRPRVCTNGTSATTQPARHLNSRCREPPR